jgi:hypothetical protein
VRRQCLLPLAQDPETLVLPGQPIKPNYWLQYNILERQRPEPPYTLDPASRLMCVPNPPGVNEVRKVLYELMPVPRERLGEVSWVQFHRMLRVRCSAPEGPRFPRPTAITPYQQAKSR